MLGQDELIDRMMSFDKLPNSILLLGKRGCGKHSLVNMIASKYNLQLVDMTDNITFESITDTYINAVPTIYLIDLNSIDVREQNMILKFVEEPSVYSHIILISESKTNILDTIYNRCLVFEFKEYSTKVLSSFITPELDKYREYIFKICDTPGQIKQLSINLDTLPKMIDLCNNVINRLSEASFGNTLTISNKLNYKDSYDKIDCDMFIRALMMLLVSKYKETDDDRIATMYMIVSKYNNRLVDSRLNKQRLVDSMLSELKRRK